MSSITKHDAIILEYLLANTKTSYIDLAEKLHSLGYFTEKSIRTIRHYISEVAKLYNTKTLPKGISATEVIQKKAVDNITITDLSSNTISESIPVRDLDEVLSLIPEYDPTLKHPVIFIHTDNDPEYADIIDHSKSVQTKIKFPEEEISRELTDRLPSGVNIFKTDDGEYTYEFETTKLGKFRFNVDTIDKIIYDYTSQGNGNTKAQVLEKHNISEEQFKVVSEAFNLSKNSVPISPASPKMLNPEQVEDFIQTQYMENISDPAVIADMKRNAATRESIKLAQQYQEKLLNLNSFIDTLVDKLPKITITYTENVYTQNSRPINVIITDIHQGSKIMKNGKVVFNTDILNDQLNKIAIKINNLYNSPEVYISILGDLHESPSGINHKNSWKGMELDAWGANAISMVTETLSNFCNKIHNLKGINMVGGNHDRILNDKDFESTDEFAKTIAYVLSKIIPVPINYDPNRVVTMIDDINYILIHGDLKDDARSAKQLAWDYGRSDKFNAILAGHYHSLIINKKDDGHNFRKVYCPSIVPTNDYAMSLGYQNNAGFTVVYNNGEGIIDMDFKSLSYNI